MRIRQVKPDFWKHDGLGELRRDARLLFIGLWAMADCEGRLKDKPKTIIAEVFPYDRDLSEGDINTWLDQLAGHPEKFITRYEVAGARYLQINGFKDHQKLQGNESSGTSKIPSPEASTAKVTTSSYPVTISNLHTDKRINGSTDLRSNGVTDPRRDGDSCRRSLRYTDEQMAAAREIFDKIRAINPAHRVPNFEVWANDIRLMVEQDQRGLDAIKQVFAWANRDEFWRKNILSPGALRKHFDKLAIQAAGTTKKAHTRVDGNNITPGSERQTGVSRLR